MTKTANLTAEEAQVIEWYRLVDSEAQTIIRKTLLLWLPPDVRLSIEAPAADEGDECV